jgi:hypothetical protein
MGNKEKNLADPQRIADMKERERLKELHMKQIDAKLEAEVAYQQTRNEIFQPCAYCKVDGHHIKDCPRLKCNKCGKQGHKRKDCVPQLVAPVTLESKNGNERNNPAWAQKLLRVYRDAECKQFVCFTGIYRGLLWMVAHEDPKALYVQTKDKAVRKLDTLNWVQFVDNHMWLAECTLPLGIKHWVKFQIPEDGVMVNVLDDNNAVSQRHTGPRTQTIRGATKLSSYDASTERGDCGQPVVHLSVQLHGVLAGIHIANQHFAWFPSDGKLQIAFPNSKNFKAPAISAPPLPTAPNAGGQ